MDEILHHFETMVGTLVTRYLLRNPIRTARFSEFGGAFERISQPSAWPTDLVLLGPPVESLK